MHKKYSSISAGDVFGHWTVVREVRAGETSQAFSQRGLYWFCRCLCGSERVVCGGELRSGRSKSCGCYPRYNKLPEGEAACNSLLNSYRWGAKHRGFVWELTRKDFVKLTKESCFYCGVPPIQRYQSNGHRTGNGSYVYNGLDRVDNQFGYTLGNTVACCKLCNLAKRTLSVKEFKLWIKRVYEHSRLDLFREVFDE